MVRDLVFAIRSLRRSSGFSTITVLTLALGLAATVTMFAAVNAAFLKPLPYSQEDELVKVYQRSATSSSIAVPLPVAREWVENNRSFAGLAAYVSGSQVNVSDGQTAARARLARVTRQFFDTMHVSPIRGRLFDEGELHTGAEPAAIISDALWQRLFGRREDALSQPLRVEGTPVPIIGVLPRGFAFPDDTDIWVTIEREGPDAYGSSTAHNFSMIGRLRPAESAPAAERDLLAITHDMASRDPDLAKENMGVAVVPLRTDLLGTQASLVLIGLGAVLAVLLIACANVINLMLARGVSREVETGIKLALGGSRGAIMRGVVAEGIVLAAAAGVLGIGGALWGTQLVTAMTPESVTGGAPLAIDWRVVSLTMAVTAIAGIVCGLVPSWWASKVDVRQTLSAGARTIAASPQRAMALLVGVEVALTVVVMFGAGLLIRSYASVQSVDSGFRTEGLTLASVSLGFVEASPYAKPEVRRAFFQRLDDAVSASPEITRVGLAAILPLGFSPNGRFEVRGRTPIVNGIHYRLVGGDYFQVLNIPVRRGRELRRTDDATHPRVAVINESLAHQVFAAADPIGQQFRMPGMDGGDDDFATIVGVVADIHHFGPSRPPVPEAYFSYLQRPARTYSMTLIVAAGVPDGVVIDRIRGAMKAIDPTVPPTFSTMSGRMAAVIEPVRFRATLLGALALVALALAGVGIVGVVSHGVARRRKEIGIRVALGATPRRIHALVLSAGLAPVVVGGVAGAAAALFLAKTLSAFLFAVRPTDVRTLAGVGVVVMIIAAAGLWWPARRAARTDPAGALRR